MEHMPQTPATRCQAREPPYRSGKQRLSRPHSLLKGRAGGYLRGC